MEQNPNQKSSLDLVELKLAELKILEEKDRLRSGLPFLHAWKHYKWGRRFYDSTNKMCLLTAGNQLSKSSTQIRKCLNWATNKDLWQVLWPKRRPRIFWYLYPSLDVAEIEFDKKWVTEFMPAETYKDDPVYGWTFNRKKMQIDFNSGITVYFKSYEQSVSNLQTATVDAVFCFEGHSCVQTKDGIKNIQDVCVGDLVFTKEGDYKPVIALKRRTTDTIRRLLSNGRYIDATADHKFWVTDRWVEFEKLTQSESLETINKWENSVKKKPSSYKATDTRDTQNPRTAGTSIFKIILDQLKDFCISAFGRKSVETSLLDTLSTTWTKIQETTRLLTWPAYRRVSTLAGTKKKSGLLGCLARVKENGALSVPAIFLLKLLKKTQLKSVARSVGAYFMEQMLAVKIASQHLLSPQTAGYSVFVLEGALERGENPVYCLTVKENHNFFVEGVCVSNCDEELPTDIYDELILRTFASDGYFNMVFTATLGQEFWRLAMECQGTPDETLVGAEKIQASAYDCLEYEDGTPSPWTVERIQRMERTCKSHNEVLKRIYGRFVRDDGLKYPTYDSLKHRADAVEIPENWLIYAGVDCGSGGETAHPAAIVFVATNPEHTLARVVKAWRGDKIVTTASDIMQKYLNMRSEIRRPVTRAFYDWAAADFGTIAARIQEPFERADKSHELGEQTINSLFKNNALILDRGDVEIDKLSLELAAMPQEGDKRKMKDDLIDAMRYALSRVAFDWFVITGGKEAQAKILPTGGVDVLLRQRKLSHEELPGFVDPESVQAEIDEWNSYLN